MSLAAMTHDLEPPLLMRMRPAFQLVGDLMIAVVLAVVAALAAQIPSAEVTPCELNHSF